MVSKKQKILTKTSMILRPFYLLYFAYDMNVTSKCKKGDDN